MGGAPSCDVWVKKGTYYIYESGPTDTVKLHSSVHLYGGFAGGETAQADAVPEANATILSGKKSAGGNVATYHVVTIAGATGGNQITSDMINLLYDFPLSDTWKFTVGGGVGIGGARGALRVNGTSLDIFRGSHAAFQWQAIAGTLSKASATGKDLLRTVGSLLGRDREGPLP